MRSRASGVARLEPSFADYAPRPCILSAFFERLFTVYGRATPDARERIPTTSHARPRLSPPRFQSLIFS